MTTPSDNPYQAPDINTSPSYISPSSEFQFREMKVFAWLAGGCIAWALPYSILILLLLTEKVSLPMEMLQLADGLQLVIFVAGVVFYCIWKYRCACNARYFYGGPLLYTPGWCVGYYFIPVMMLFRPYQCMKDIYEKTYLPMRKSAPTGLVLGWWLSWIFSGIFERISMKTEAREIMFINQSLSIVSAGLALWVIYTLTRRQYEVISDESLRSVIGQSSPLQHRTFHAADGIPMQKAHLPPAVPPSNQD